MTLKRTEILCFSVLRVTWGPTVKAGHKRALNPAVVYFTDRSYSLLLCGLFYEANFCFMSCRIIFFCVFSIVNTPLGEKRASLDAFRTFVQFALVWFCLFPLPLGVWVGLRFVILALPGLFSYLFF